MPKPKRGGETGQQIHGPTGVEITEQQARDYVRLVLVADNEGEAEERDWATVRQITEYFGWPYPTDISDLYRYDDSSPNPDSTWRHYWGDDVPDLDAG